MNALRLSLYAEQDRVVEPVRSMGQGSVVVRSFRSPAKETPNEDSVAVLGVDAERCVLAVADGVGGLPGGARASARALEALCEGVEREVLSGQSLREGVLSGLDRANELVMKLENGSATTLVIAQIDAEGVRTYNIGDSGALVFGSEGRILLQTIAHSPVGYAVEAGLLDEEQAIRHEGRHLVSNVIGYSGMHIGLNPPRALQTTDTVLIASDGLFDNVLSATIVDTLRSGSLEQGVDRLVAQARERMAEGGKPDDLSLIAYRRRSA